VKKEGLKLLIESLGKPYSEVLDINLSCRKDKEIFKWFLASILFGAPITETSVIKTYRCFQKYNLLTPDKILSTGWKGLVKILDEGSYTRYDFKTADKLLGVMQNLKQQYEGSINNLYNKASNSLDLEERLKRLGKGIGNVTISIFLRDLRDVWKKADPKPTSLVILAAQNLGIVEKQATIENASKQLNEFWLKNGVSGQSFIKFETALLRLGKDFCRKQKCAACAFKNECQAIGVP
jgi:endonuclease III